MHHVIKELPMVGSTGRTKGYLPSINGSKGRLQEVEEQKFISSIRESFSALRKYMRIRDAFMDVRSQNNL